MLCDLRFTLVLCHNMLWDHASWGRGKMTVEWVSFLPRLQGTYSWHTCISLWQITAYLSVIFSLWVWKTVPGRKVCMHAKLCQIVKCTVSFSSLHMSRTWCLSLQCVLKTFLAAIHCLDLCFFLYLNCTPIYIDHISTTAMYRHIYNEIDGSDFRRLCDIIPSWCAQDHNVWQKCVLRPVYAQNYFPRDKNKLLYF